MDALPHRYTTIAKGASETSTVTVSAQGVPDISTDAPAEFGGPGNVWSPEGLLMAAVADCFILTFRAISAASKVAWHAIECQATGTLDRVERQTLFTAIELQVSVTAAADVNEGMLERLLHKAEEACLITNSLSAPITLSTSIHRP